MWRFIGLIKDKPNGLTDKVGISFYILLLLFNVLYFAALYGVIFVNTKYINIFNIIVHSLLCLFLIYKFNPLQKDIEVKQYDQLIIFSIALFLLINLGIVEYLKTIINGSNIVKIDMKTTS